MTYVEEMTFYVNGMTYHLICSRSYYAVRTMEQLIMSSELPLYLI